MRQAVMVSPGKIEYRNVSDPSPSNGQVLMRIGRIGICGSDIHVNHGKHPFTLYPVVQGHEFSAVVEAVGEGVDLPLGAKVTATPQEVCGRCRPCLRGEYNVCESLKVRGFQAPGVAQDLFVTEADKIVRLPADFTPEQGAFVEPVAVAAHSTGRAGDVTGKNVVVLGAGPIGNFAAQACRARGAKKVLITDMSPYRLKIAHQVGIDAVSCAADEPLVAAAKRVFGDEGFDLAMEASGSEAAITQAVAAIGKGGRIVVLGVFSRKPAIDMACVCEHELSVVGTMMYRHEDYEQAVSWIASGQVRTEPLDSKHFSFEQFADAYAYIDSQGSNCVKVFIDL